MINYTNFFTSSVTASATLVGLLFVSLAVDAVLETKVKTKQLLVSRSAFIALAGIFILSFLQILIPISWVTMSATIIISILGLMDMLLTRRTNAETNREYRFIILTIFSYLLLSGSSIWFFLKPSSMYAMMYYGIACIMLYAFALMAAWRSLILTKSI